MWINTVRTGAITKHNKVMLRMDFGLENIIENNSIIELCRVFIYNSAPMAMKIPEGVFINSQ
jgi:hypothetical protein